MAPISLCMIVKNEHDTLARCLESVRETVDEIVIVDTGSTDDTKEIARRYTDRVLDFVWQDDFSLARNFAFSQARCDFILWLDADDIWEDAPALMDFKKTRLDAFDVVMVPYHVGFDAQGNPAFTYYRERILRRSMGFIWEGAVHEAIVPRGRIGYADFAVRHAKNAGAPHDPQRNLRIYEGLKAKGHVFCARERFYYGRELRTAGRFAQAAEQLRSVIDDDQAWLENRIEACADLSACLLSMGDAQGAMRALTDSFALCAPRPKVACLLGERFLEKNCLQAARFWYESALTLREDEKTGAFVQKEYSGYIPLMQLCVIFDRLGEKEKARAYNERAGALRPDDPAVAHNRRYFAQVLQG